MSSRVPLALPARHLAPISAEVDAAVSEVIASGRWLKGPATSAFEDAFAVAVGARWALGVGNGTDGLELALRAAGAAGHEVVTVANAGMYTTAACRIVGATPVWVDVDDRLVMDIEAMADALTDATRAVVATHLYGNVVDVPALRARLAEAGRDDVIVIEDGSQAHGASLDDQPVGSMGDLAVFSFYPTKNLGALGDAGAVVGRDEELMTAVQQLHQYGWRSRYDSVVPFGRNSRMDEVQAAVLGVKLPHLDAWNEERRAIALRYESALGPGRRLVTDVAGAGHLAVIESPTRDDDRAALDASHIDTDIHFPCLDPDQPSQQGLPGRRHDLGRSETAAGCIYTVPSHPGMPADEVERVADALSSLADVP